MTFDGTSAPVIEMQILSFITLTVIAGMSFVDAIDECDKIRECEEMLRRPDGEEYQTIEHHAPNSADLHSMCAGPASRYTTCMKGVDLFQCSDKRKRVQAILTKGVTATACNMRKYLSTDRCAKFLLNQEEMAVNAAKKCGFLKLYVTSDRLDSTQKCRHAAGLMRCIAGSIRHVCPEGYMTFFAHLQMTMISTLDCNTYFDLAKTVYETEANQIPGAYDNFVHAVV